MSADNTGSGGRADEDAAWRNIVEHYGERVTLSAQEIGDEAEPPEALDAPEAAEAGAAHAAMPAFAPGYDPLVDDPDAFVPPEPPPLPKLPPDRLMAWVGVLGAPVAVIVLVVLDFAFRWIAPHWLDALIALAFLGGFGYLVTKMPKDDDEPWDDGARV